MGLQKFLVVLDKFRVLAVMKSFQKALKESAEVDLLSFEKAEMEECSNADKAHNQY